MGGGGRREPGPQRAERLPALEVGSEKAPRGTLASDKCFSAVKTGPRLRGSAWPPLSELGREPLTSSAALGLTAFPICTVHRHCIILQAPLCSENSP